MNQEQEIKIYVTAQNFRDYLNTIDSIPDIWVSIKNLWDIWYKEYSTKSDISARYFYSFEKVTKFFLSNNFSWVSTEQGHKYWESIYRKLVNNNTYLNSKEIFLFGIIYSDSLKDFIPINI